MMHLPGQLQWDCKTIKPCHKRLHLLMSATSIHSITVVTHLLKSFKFLCLTSYVGFDKLRGTDEKNCVSTYKICPGMGKKKARTQLHPKFFITKLLTQPPEKKKKKKKWKIGMFDNDISHKWFHLYMPYAKIYWNPNQHYVKRNRVGRVISL